MPVQGIRWLMVGIGLLAAEAASAQQYTLTDLGPRPYARASAINATGQVVGDWGLSLHAFIWTDGTMQDLDPLPGTDQCVARAINDSGQVVGWCRVYSAGDQAFLWTSETGMAALPIPGPAQAHGINNQGHIVGWYGDPAHAFLYRNGVVKDLGVGQAFGINDQDQVMGHTDDPAAETSVAMLWDDAGPHELDSEGGSSWASAISTSGLIAGYSTRGGPYRGAYHAVLWTPYGVSDLGTFGGFFSLAFAINGDLIVGRSETASRATRAFLYDINGPGYPVDLNDLVVPPSDWQLYAATGVNAAGQIVGYGDLHGELEAFLLTPVQPTTTSR